MDKIPGNYFVKPMNDLLAEIERLRAENERLTDDLETCNKVYREAQTENEISQWSENYGTRESLVLFRSVLDSILRCNIEQEYAILPEEAKALKDVFAKCDELKAANELITSELETYRVTLADNEAYLMELSARVPRFTPVTDHLPEKTIAVIVAIETVIPGKYDAIGALFEVGKKSWDYCFVTYKGVDITKYVFAWTPMPSTEGL